MDRFERFLIIEYILRGWEVPYESAILKKWAMWCEQMEHWGYVETVHYLSTCDDRIYGQRH